MLEPLARIVQEVNSAHDLDDALALIVRRVKSVIKADVCSVYMTDDARKEHVLVATDGLPQEIVGNVRLALGQGLTGLAAIRAEPVNVEDALTHANFRYVAVVDETAFHGFLGVPIVRRRETFGVLVVQQRLRRKYTLEEESFMVTLAAQLAGSLTQAKIHENLNRLDRNTLDGTLFLEGVTSARGLGIGEAVVVFPVTDLAQVPDKHIDDTEPEMERFRQAIEAELVEIERLGERMKGILSPGDQALFDAYALLLSSDSLVNGTLERISQGNWAPGALSATILEYANAFEEMDDPYLQGRAADIRDLGRRLLKRLQQEQAVDRYYPENTILMGEEIDVSEFLQVPSERLSGLVSVGGTSASHVALLARGLGIPAVFGVSDVPLGRLNGREVVVDGYASRVCIQPGPTLRQEYVDLAKQEAELSRELQELKDLPSQTPDGKSFHLYTNSGLFADIAAGRDIGAEGVGLYRSELHFFLRDRFPSEEEQTKIYTRVLRTMDPLPVTLRTLDVGGDKPLPYYPISEQNPFLGWRGIRVSLDQPDIFKTQLRAMLRAGAAFPHLSIMFPMISCVSELVEAIQVLRQAHAELVEDGLPVIYPKVGIMVEVPSAVYQIRTLAKLVDFVAIGSNDLTQYILAVDRNNDRVAKLYDNVHPAVLHALCAIIKGARETERQVSVCGEMAGDPAAVLLLMGMGVDSLSMSLGNLLKVKWTIRTITVKQCEQLLSQALKMDNSEPVRVMLNRVLEEHGLGGLVRAGK